MSGRNIYKLIYLLGASLAPTFASAQSSSLPSSSGQSASELAEQMYQNPGLLIIATGLVVGFATVISGIYHFKKTADNKLQYPVGEGIAKLIAGCLMLSFTFVYTLVKNSLLTGGNTQWYNTGNDAIAISTVVQASEDYSSNSFLDAFLTDEFRAIIFGILWLVGLVFLFTGIYQLKNVTKAEEGSIRNPIIRILGSIACMNPMLVLCLISSLGPTFLCSEG